MPTPRTVTETLKGISMVAVQHQHLKVSLVIHKTYSSKEIFQGLSVAY